MPPSTPPRLTATLLLAALTGCTQPGPQTPAQTLAFPIPAGWSITPPAPITPPLPENTPPDATIRLHDPTNTCRIQFSRTLSTRPVAAAADDMRAAFDKAGHPTTPQPAMSLGGAPTTHFSIAFPGSNPPTTRLVENVYLAASGNDLLTLVTIHAAQCRFDFQSILDNFHI